MYIKKILLCCYLMALPQFLVAQIRADIKQNEIVTMSAQGYVFLNHATADWDPLKKTLPSINSILAFSKNNFIDVIATVHTDAFLNPYNELGHYFISNSTAKYIVHSDGGAHQLKFPNAKYLIVGGGNLHVCLCESLRDMVSGLMPIKENKEIYMVEEAIFDNDFKGLPLNDKEMFTFASTYLFPHFSCPDQVSTGYGPIKTDGINLKFYSHGKLLIESSPGNTRLPSLSFRFDTWAAIQKYLQNLK